MTFDVAIYLVAKSIVCPSKLLSNVRYLWTCAIYLRTLAFGVLAYSYFSMYCTIHNNSHDIIMYIALFSTLCVCVPREETQP